MKRWKQYLLLNSVATIAALCSIFVVPPSTPIRVWAAVSGSAIALMNVALYRRLNRPKTSVKLAVIIIIIYAVQIAEGGWQQYVAYVAFAVVALTAVIYWIAKKAVRED